MHRTGCCFPGCPSTVALSGVTVRRWAADVSSHTPCMLQEVYHGACGAVISCERVPCFSVRVLASGFCGYGVRVEAGIHTLRALPVMAWCL